MQAVGRDAHDYAVDTGVRSRVEAIVRLFHDAPTPDARFSIHAICAAGARYGLVAGRWMGPYALCRALADLAAAGAAAGVRVATLDSGGGAPCVDVDGCAAPFFALAPAPKQAPMQALRRARRALSRASSCGRREGRGDVGVTMQAA